MTRALALYGSALRHPLLCLLKGSYRTLVEGQLSNPQGLWRVQSLWFLRLEVSVYKPPESPMFGVGNE
jgi:hypothetical protein